MNDDQHDMTPMSDDLAQRYPHDFGGPAPSQPSALPYGQAAAGEAGKMMPNDYPTGYPGEYGEAMPSGQRMMPNDYPTRFGGAEPRKTPIPGCVKWLGGCLAVGLIGLLVLGCIFGSVAHAFFSSPEVSKTTSQDFTVTGIPLIRVHNEAGDVTTQQGNDNTVHVQVEKHAQALPGNNAQSQLNAITVTMTQTGNTIDVQVQTSDGNGFWPNHRWADIVIQTPAASNLDFTTTAGNITADAINGTMSMTTDAGNIKINDATLTSNSTFHSDAGNLKFEAVTDNANTTIRTNAGDVEFDGTLGQNIRLNVQTDAGNVNLKLPTDTDAHFKATTDAGSITIDSLWSSITVNQQDANASATGDMGTNPTDTITVSTHAGDVNVEPR